MRKILGLLVPLLLACGSAWGSIERIPASWNENADSAKINILASDALTTIDSSATTARTGGAVRNYDTTVSLNRIDSAYFVQVEIWYPGADTSTGYIFPFPRLIDSVTLSRIVAAIAWGSNAITTSTLQEREVDVQAISDNTAADANLAEAFDGDGIMQVVDIVREELGSVNLVRNPGFERDSAVANTAPEFWTKGDGTHTLDFSKTSTMGGRWEFLIDPAANETSFVYQYIGHIDGGTYWLGGTVSGNTTLDTVGWIVVDNVIPTTTSEHIDSVGFDTTAPAEVGKAVILPTGDIFIGLRVDATGVGQDAEFDNIKLIPLGFDTSAYKSAGDTSQYGPTDIVTGGAITTAGGAVVTVTNVTNQVTADMTAISGDPNAADSLEFGLDGVVETNRERLFTNLDEVLSTRSTIGDTGLSADEVLDSIKLYDTRFDSLLAAASDVAKGHIGDSTANATWNHANRYIKNADHGSLMLNNSFEDDTVSATTAPAKWNLGAGTHTNNKIIGATEGPIGDGRWSYRLNLETSTDTSIIWQQLGEIESGAYSVSAILSGSSVATKQIFIASATPATASPALLDSAQHAFIGARQLQFIFIQPPSPTNPIFFGFKGGGATGTAIIDDAQFVPIGWDSAANQGAAGSLDSGKVSRIMHRVGWGTPRGSGSDSSTLAERDVIVVAGGGGLQTIVIGATDTAGADIDTRISGVPVDLFDAAGNQIGETQITNGDGYTTWGLTTSDVVTVQTGSNIYNSHQMSVVPRTFTVGTTGDTVACSHSTTPGDCVLPGDDLIITAPAAAQLTRVYNNIETLAGIGVENVTVTIGLSQLNTLDTSRNVILTPDVAIDITDVNGLFEIDVVRSNLLTPPQPYFINAWTGRGRRRIVYINNIEIQPADSATWKLVWPN